LSSFTAEWESHEMGEWDLPVICNLKHKFGFTLSLRILWKRNFNNCLNPVLQTNESDISINLCFRTWSCQSKCY
jgi:hypothetical protein